MKGGVISIHGLQYAFSVRFISTLYSVYSVQCEQCTYLSPSSSVPTAVLALSPAAGFCVLFLLCCGCGAVPGRSLCTFPFYYIVYLTVLTVLTVLSEKILAKGSLELSKFENLKV